VLTREALAWHDDPAVLQILQEIPEQENGLCGNAHYLACLFHQGRAIFATTYPVAAQVENLPLLPVAGLFEPGGDKRGTVFWKGRIAKSRSCFKPQN